VRQVRIRLASIVAAGAIALAGCEPFPAPPPPTPKPRPELPGPAVKAPSDVSRALSVYYKRLQNDLLARGLLRTDGGGPDVPFSSRNLTENFLRIALYDELVSSNGRLVARETRSRLRCWNRPIRIAMEFGETVPLAQRKSDRAVTAAYARRLARLTGVSVAMSASGGGNFHVAILNEDERRAFGPRLRELLPGIHDEEVNLDTGMPRSTYCLVLAFSDAPGSNTYSRAVAVIRGEHPDLLRKACVHEELAQAMGLPNDSPAARPSIFNDDEEFGFLTHHDELLLHILYDKRLSPGMTPAEARPVVATIAAELLGGES